MKVITESMGNMGKTFKGMIISAVTAWLVVFAGAAVSALLVYKGVIGEKGLKAAVNIIYFISCFAAVLISRRNFESRSFLKGAAAGMLFFATLFIVSAVFGDGRGVSDALTAFTLCALGGMLAGMLA